MSWVSVKDALPENKGRYLVYAPTYKCGSSRGLNNYKGLMFCWFNGVSWGIENGYYDRPGCVRYWMPLPELPEEEVNAKGNH